MAVRIAYGGKDNIDAAIESGTIPADSIIITKDGNEPEMMFYDRFGTLKLIEERNRFETFSEAQAWAKKYNCAGHIFSIQNGADWVPYIVQTDGSLSTIKGEATIVDGVKCIDGGSAAGLE